MNRTKGVLLITALIIMGCGPTGGAVKTAGQDPMNTPLTFDGGMTPLNVASGDGTMKCADGKAPLCDFTNESYYCFCPPMVPVDAGIDTLPPTQPVPFVASDAAPLPTVPPTPATLSPDASIPEFPTFSPVTPPDAAPIDVPAPVTPPEPIVQPDAYVPPAIVFPTFPKPETPDAMVVISIPEPDARPVPDTKLPEDTRPVVKLDCGCVEEPTPPAIIPDASLPDTMPIVIVPDAGIDTMPDTQPDRQPDRQPDLTPDLTPDTQPTGCAGGTTITASLTPPPLVVVEHCYSKTIYWEVAGCPLTGTGFKVIWSEKLGPQCPPRTSDAGIIDNLNNVSDISMRSLSINDKQGAGNYYVMVCEDMNGACGVCSAPITIALTSN